MPETEAMSGEGETFTEIVTQQTELAFVAKRTTTLFVQNHVRKKFYFYVNESKITLLTV
jgi:hypothetical protein